MREDQERIFEPFFSTKPRGKGTGLGLAMVFGFVKRSKGHINVYSEQGIGTTFRLYLPRSTEEEQVEKKHSITKESALPWGNETILVVDDEMELLELAKELLTTLGYTVLSATNGKEAIAHLTQNRKIVLLFTDVVMSGGMNGFELAELAMVGRPTLKVLLTSGYTGKSLPSDGMERFIGKLITKPYSQTELAHRVGAALDTPGMTDIKQDIDITEEQREEHIDIQWSDEFSIGIEAIDDDHKILLEQVNKCQKLVAGDDENIGEILDNLGRYTTSHFKREEIVMESCGYPGLANHRQVHKLLIKQLEEKRQLYQQGLLNEQTLSVFLTSWLMDHIKTMDRAYAPYCDGANDIIKQSLLDAANEK